MKERGSAAGALTPLGYSAFTDRDSTPVDPFAKELPIEFDLEDSDDNIEEGIP